MKNKLISLFLSLSLIFSSLLFVCCEKELEKFSNYSFDYFDTVTTVIGYAESEDEFNLVYERILKDLNEYHKAFTIYNRFDGLENLCTVNELTDGVHPTVKLDTKVIDMLEYAKRMYTLTDGKVNVAMGSVLSLWHEYRTLGSDDPANASLPPIDKLNEASNHTDIDNIVIDRENCTVTLTDPNMTLDVGAIAKGYAVEMIAQSLEADGISNYVLNVGGNVRTIGAKADGDKWTVGIENPQDTENSESIALLELAGESLVTSGSYQRYYYVDGKRYHHIIDPETLMPADHFLSVSVVTNHSGLADAISTALFCMDLDDGIAFVESLNDVEALWVTKDAQIHYSSGFSKYLAKTK